MSTPWITVDEVKEDLKWTQTDTTFDATLQRIVSGVCAAIESYCGRRFVAEDVTEKFDGDGSDTLLLRFPVVSVTSVDNDGTIIASADRDIDTETGELILLESEFLTGRRNVTVVYRFGYEPETFPADLKIAALLWVAILFIDIKDSRLGVTGTSHGDESISFMKGLPDEVARTVASYRRIL